MWGQDDFWKGFQSKNGANALIGLGTGLLSGNNFAKGLAAGGQGFMRGAELDNQYMLEAEEKAKEEQSRNATVEWLQSQGYDDLVQMAQATGDIGAAWSEGLKRSQPQAPNMTADMQNYLFSQQHPDFADFINGGPETVINNNMGATDAYYDQLDKNLATQTSDLINAGMNAQSNNIRLGELDRLLQSAPQGMEGSFVQMAGSLGIPTQGVDEVQAAQALINQMVPGQRPPGSGTMSDADLALFKASLPQIINQPGGNQMILSTMKAINEYTVAQAEIAQAVANRQITPAEGRRLQGQVPNPLANYKAPAASPAANDPLGIR
jgi:hypothetical protein